MKDRMETGCAGTRLSRRAKWTTWVGAVAAGVLVFGISAPGTVQANPASEPGEPVAVASGSIESTDETSDPVDSVIGSEPEEQLADRAGSRRGGRAARNFATPRRGEITIVRMLVRARSVPRLTLTAAGSRRALHSVTGVGGVRRLARSGAWVKYGVTVPVFKWKNRRSVNERAGLTLDVQARGLRVIKSRIVKRADKRRAPKEMCTRVTALDINLTGASRVRMQNRVLLGRLPKGFSRARHLGAFAVQQACGLPVPRSFLNVLRGVRLPAVRSATETRSSLTVRSAPAINSGAGTTDAVVLVSGWTSETPFTSPGNVCSASGNSAGGTFSYVDAALQAAGLPVFTAPTMGGSGAVDPSAIGVGTCAEAQLPASMTLNTLGDADTNAANLASFLNYLHTQFGIVRVWLVGHSDGGIWSRGAIDYSSAMPGISVQSITTIDTPHTGAFAADLSENIMGHNCDSLDLVCKAFVDGLTDLMADDAPGAALPELTSTYMSAWNSRMIGVMGALPLWVISADGVNDPHIASWIGDENDVNEAGDDPYVNPNDIVVGISSQQAAGLTTMGVIQTRACFDTVNALHTTLPTAISDSLAAVDLINTTAAVTDVPQTVTNVEAVLAGNPPGGACSS